jgi:hypothetical protein
MLKGLWEQTKADIGAALKKTKTSEPSNGAPPMPAGSDKNKPRWQRILEMEALAREMDKIEEDNRQATGPTGLEAVRDPGKKPPASHQVVRREVYKRGPFGKIIKFLFIAFNVLMVIWLVSYWVQVGSMRNELVITNKDFAHAADAGAAIGAAIGTTILMFVWAAGSTVHGFLTMFSRGEKLIIEETMDVGDA